MDPNLIARILGRNRPPNQMNDPFQVGASSAPMIPQDPAMLYAQAPPTVQNQPMPPMSNPFLPNAQADQALQQAGSPELNPIIQQIMQHLGFLNMIRNRSAQPFMNQNY